MGGERYGKVTRETAAQLIEILRHSDCAGDMVLSAMAAVPRALFVPPALRRRAYDNISLPIDCEQTISQPQIVAIMTDSLQLERPNTYRVLEIGTGSGYQTAILAHLARRVYSIERHKPLLEEALARFAALGLSDKIVTHLGDGTMGWPDATSFDRIIITAAAAATIPPAILRQCSLGGIIVAPIEQGGEQYLTRLTRLGHGLNINFVARSHLGFDGVGAGDKTPMDTPDFIAEEICPVRFVPLVADKDDNDHKESLKAVLRRLNR